MTRTRELRRNLQHSTEELVRATLDGELDWEDFLWSREQQVEISGLGPVVAGARQHDESLTPWIGPTILASWAPTPIVVHDERFASVESFYHALKFPEGSAERAAIASQRGTTAATVALRKRADSFVYRGRTVQVGSSEHAGIVGHAVAMKVQQHERVESALMATGHALLTFPYGADSRNALARATPIALAIERARRR